MQGRTLDAIATVQKGLRVRPHPVLYNNLGTYLYFLGQYPQSAQAFERLMELDGNTHNFTMWGNLADAYRWTPGKEDKAATAYRVALRLVDARLKDNPAHPVRNAFKALCHAKLGEAEPALAALAAALARPNPAILFQAALVHEILGNRAQALGFLHRAIQAGYGAEEIVNEPELSRLRQDRRYQEIILANKD
jgi:serine/threonine-protein kinase